MTVADAPQEIPLAPAGQRPHPEPRPFAPPADHVDAPPPPPPLAKPERLASLDVFRGITIAAMLLVNNPGSWGHMYAPLGHADWHGWTPTDLIFPFFLFIVGVAIPFSFGKRAASDDKRAALAHVWSRSLSLVLLGLLLHSVPSTGLDPVRPPGFAWLGVLRVATLVVVPLGFVLLLFPWWPRRVSLMMPPVVAVLLLGLGLAIHYATRGAVAAGLASSFDVGNGLFRPSHVRFPGVLQRIGVCYGVAATVALFAGRRTILLSLVACLCVYAALMLMAPFADHATGSLTKEDNLARRIDETVFDRYGQDAGGQRVARARHAYAEYPDPEGLLSTLPAIGSVLLGVLAGLGLRATDRTHAEKCARLLAHGVLVAVAGVLLGWWLMPINKKIWTPSFTVFTAGMGMLALGAVFYLTDVKGRRAWAWPFKVYGMNAIAAFVLAGLVGRTGNVIQLTDSATQKPVGLLQFGKDHVAATVHRAGDGWEAALPHLPPLDTPNNLSLAWALTFVLAMFVVMALMYVCRIFLKV